MKIYGLTGGIAAGKSEVARRLIELQIPVIDADKIGHEVLEAGGAAEQAVIGLFGESILSRGIIDRDKISAIVFKDPEALKKLNATVHPAIRLEMGRRCAALAEQGAKYAVIEAALLAEDGKVSEMFDGLIVVTCPADIRVRRLVQDRGMSEQEAIRRVEAQTPPEKKEALADWLIHNAGDLASLTEQLEAIVGDLKSDD